MRGELVVWIDNVNDQHGMRTVKMAKTKLPSGLSIAFRVPGPYGWLSIWRAIPTIGTANDKPAPAKPSAPDDHTMIDKALRTMVEFSVQPRIVNKPPSETVDGEMSAWLISDDDVATFLEDVAAAMGYTGEQAQAASEIVS